MKMSWQPSFTASKEGSPLAVLMWQVDYAECAVKRPNSIVEGLL